MPSWRSLLSDWALSLGCRIQRQVSTAVSQLDYRGVDLGGSQTPSGVWGPTPIGNSWQGRVDTPGLFSGGSCVTLWATLVKPGLTPGLGVKTLD
jgi:hypothetical protein